MGEKEGKSIKKKTRQRKFLPVSYNSIKKAQELCLLQKKKYQTSLLTVQFFRYFFQKGISKI